MTASGHTHVTWERLVAHCDYRAETHVSLFDALISFSDLVQNVSFGNHLNFAAGGDLERFVEIFTAILLTAENPKAAINETAGMD